MSGRTNNQRYLLWLALGTAAMALAMASLLVFELAQRRALEQSDSIRSDSLTALAFQFEREFLRVRQTVGEALANKDAIDQDALSLRYDIFLSRLGLLKDSPSVSLLTAREEYRRVMPRLEALVVQMDKTLGSPPIKRDALIPVQEELNGLGADVQAMTLAANSEVARLLERQSDTMQKQNNLIVWLTVAQLALLIVASGALFVRQKRVEAERLALEQLTDELREARFRAEAANRGKSQFLANMSHELRTPFNGLMGMLGLLQSTPVTPQQADYIGTAQASAGHLLSLLNDVLDVSALETGKLTLKPAPVSLNRLLGNVQALMQPLAREKGLDFELELPPERLPAVLADETRLKQILFNLLNNAIKFTEKGQVLLHVAVLTPKEPLVALVFTIQDTGIGMDAKAMERLFQRFYQVDDSATRKFGGTGLGLEISQSLARMMQGDITVTSAPGAGSTFTVTLNLPACEEPVAVQTTAPAVEVAPTEVAMPASTVESFASGVPAMRVLVVEDHPINQKLVGLLLTRMGCESTFCENGQLAVDLVQQESFDMVLMDVNMPVMDGLTATRLIRGMSGALSRLPIVVLTADVMNEARDQAMAAGADDFLSKPVNVAQLRSIVSRYSNGKVSD